MRAGSPCGREIPRLEAGVAAPGVLTVPSPSTARLSGRLLLHQGRSDLPRKPPDGLATT
ncbi:hypothetical protein VULLAG_LOCUS8346 [Vulpes lagopus]